MPLIDTEALCPNKVFFINTTNPMQSLNELLFRIANAKTVDAVEVVRCKDCKHRNRYYCFHPEQMYLAVDIDYYCARGERRES